MKNPPTRPYSLQELEFYKKDLQISQPNIAADPPKLPTPKKIVIIDSPKEIELLDRLLEITHQEEITSTKPSGINWLFVGGIACVVIAAFLLISRYQKAKQEKERKNTLSHR